MIRAATAPRAAVPISNAGAPLCTDLGGRCWEPAAGASRRNGAKSRGPRTPEGKARSARNAPKYGLRGEKYVLLADEEAAEFGAFEAALILELASRRRAPLRGDLGGRPRELGAQSALARRITVAPGG